MAFASLHIATKSKQYYRQLISSTYDNGAVSTMKYIAALFVMMLSSSAYSEAMSFWLQSAYTDVITVNKAKKAFKDLGPQLNRQVNFRSSSTTKELMDNIENVDLVIWGDSKEFIDVMSKSKFVKILKSEIKVYLFKPSKIKTASKQSTKVGVLKLSTAKAVAQNYYNDSGVKYNIVSFDNYNLALSALYAGEIDYIAATNTLTAALSPAASKTLSRVLTFPIKGKIVVLLNSSKLELKSKIQKYFISQSPYIDIFFGTGKFSTGEFSTGEFSTGEFSPNDTSLNK